jgi:hypothetical protein
MRKQQAKARCRFDPKSSRFSRFQEERLICTVRCLCGQMRGVEPMSPDERKHVLRRDLGLAAIVVAVGLSVSGLSFVELRARQPQRLAQATPTPQASPSDQPAPPAESKPGGTRPTTPAPEPAHPDAQAQRAGATPVLPPAPAEKIAPPIDKK